uniref:Uncharacterized protein n=1 Tax=Bionectria ochroleuca TaxID=29856 RepID=A0A8H7NE47_BIOOC
MFCLRSWLPLLFIPTNASPSFIFLFFVCTYFLNKPSDWFRPRPETTPDDGSLVIVEMFNTTVKALAGVAADELRAKRAEWTGLGMEWLRSLLGRREWAIDCMDIKIRL